MYCCKTSWPKIKAMYICCEGHKLSFKGLEEDFNTFAYF